MTTQERAEADLLTGRAYEYNIAYRERIPYVKFLPFLGGRNVLRYETMKIQSPTLAVLDVLSCEWAEIEVDDNAFKSSNNEAIIVARKLVHIHAKRLARIVAIATLGEQAFKIKYTAGSYIERELDEKAIALLAGRVYRSVQPAQLAEIARAICAQSDLPNFLSAITLMRGATTIKNQVIGQ